MVLGRKCLRRKASHDYAVEVITLTAPSKLYLRRMINNVHDVGNDYFATLVN